MIPLSRCKLLKLLFYYYKINFCCLLYRFFFPFCNNSLEIKEINFLTLSFLEVPYCTRVGLGGYLDNNFRNKFLSSPPFFSYVIAFMTIDIWWKIEPHHCMLQCLLIFIIDPDHIILYWWIITRQAIISELRNAMSTLCSSSWNNH